MLEKVWTVPPLRVTRKPSPGRIPPVQACFLVESNLDHFLLALGRAAESLLVLVKTPNMYRGGHFHRGSSK